MTDAYGRTTESEISRAVLGILADRDNGEAKYRDLLTEIPNRIQLTSADTTQSPTRPHEAVWEQRVRNIRSHKNVDGNYIANGFLEGTRGGLRITNAGRDFLNGLKKRHSR